VKDKILELILGMFLHLEWIENDFLNKAQE
jgi:hypothetical protein